MATGCHLRDDRQIEIQSGESSEDVTPLVDAIVERLRDTTNLATNVWRQSATNFFVTFQQCWMIYGRLRSGDEAEVRRMASGSYFGHGGLDVLCLRARIEGTSLGAEEAEIRETQRDMQKCSANAAIWKKTRSAQLLSGHMESAGSRA